MKLQKGTLGARLAEDAGDVARAQALRFLSFRARQGQDGAADRDFDAFDAGCHHVLVENTTTGQLLACCRLMTFAHGESLDHGYSGQFYDLAALRAFAGPKVELGRFCLYPDHPDPDVLRLAWAAITRFVDERGSTLLFGCTSFEGAQIGTHRQGLALLQARHLAPAQWQPAIKAAETVMLGQGVAPKDFDAKAALAQIPPLLRTYLAMGAWVSDHAVIDRDLDTLHVLTGLEVARIPAARARALRALAC